MDDQSTELREYLSEAEYIAREWYSREGVEGSHENNIDRLATLFVLGTIMSSERTFEEVRATARIYLVSAFQMGRAAHGDDCCIS